VYSDPIKRVLHSDSNTMSTRIQAQCVLRLGLERKGVIRLGYKHHVYSD
jgi:hypothetical protein